MIEGMLNQTATWKHKTGNNGYSEPVFADPVNVKVRWEGKRRLVRNPQGKEVVSEARVFCREEIQPEDTLAFAGQEWIVIAVSEMPGMDGKVWFREVAV